MHPYHSFGDCFRLLGLPIDPTLSMHDGIQKLVKRLRPKLQALMRTRQCDSLEDMMLQYKSHVLSVAESNIGVIYHACSILLAPLDRLQTTYVHNLNLSIEEAFLHHNLAPLNLRRDISMLGFLHKLKLEHAHPDIFKLFPRAPNRRLWNRLHECRHVAQHDVTKRSIFQLVEFTTICPDQL